MNPVQRLLSRFRPRPRDPVTADDIPALARMSAQIRPMLIQPHEFTSTEMLRFHSRADWEGTRPELLEFAHFFFLAARRRQFPLFVHTAWRDPDTQLDLYARGHSKLRSGPHQRGSALDIVHPWLLWDAMPSAGWEWLGILGKEVIRQRSLPISWGGDWSFKDPAHWQLNDWSSAPVVAKGHVPLRRSPYAML